MALPTTLLAVREVGDLENAYWFAACADGTGPALEVGERMLWQGYGNVTGVGSNSFVSEYNALVFTDRRLMWLTNDFDKGGGWTGIGPGGMAVALVANQVSKRRAAGRRRGKIALGQVRLEWITGLRLRHRKSLRGGFDSFLDVSVATGQRATTVTFSGRNVVTEQFARATAHNAAGHRLGLGIVLSGPTVPNSCGRPTAPRRRTPPVAGRLRPRGASLATLRQRSTRRTPAVCRSARRCGS